MLHKVITLNKTGIVPLLYNVDTDYFYSMLNGKEVVSNEVGELVKQSLRVIKSYDKYFNAFHKEISGTNINCCISEDINSVFDYSQLIDAQNFGSTLDSSPVAKKPRYGKNILNLSSDRGVRTRTQVLNAPTGRDFVLPMFNIIDIQYAKKVREKINLNARYSRSNYIIEESGSIIETGLLMYYRMHNCTYKYFNILSMSYDDITLQSAPCHNCGLVLPIKFLEVDHIHPQAGNGILAACKVLKQYGLSNVAAHHVRPWIEGSASGSTVGSVRAGVRGQEMGVYKKQDRDSENFSLNLRGIYYLSTTHKIGDDLRNYTNDIANLQLLCPLCNNAKSDTA